MNLSPTAGRATPLDEEMVTSLEATVTVDRQAMYDDLIRAKADIEGLTSSQVLRKDLKIVGGVPISVAPVLINELRKRPDFEQAVVDFMRVRNDAPIMVLIGVHQGVIRDLAVFGKSSKVVDAVLGPLTSSTDPDLQLEEVLDHGVSPMRLFRQGNVKATRKQIAPIVSKAAICMEEITRCGLG